MPVYTLITLYAIPMYGLCTTWKRVSSIGGVDTLSLCMFPGCECYACDTSAWRARPCYSQIIARCERMEYVCRPLDGLPRHVTDTRDIVGLVRRMMGVRARDVRYLTYHASDGTIRKYIVAKDGSRKAKIVLRKVIQKHLDTMTIDEYYSLVYAEICEAR